MQTLLKQGADGNAVNAALPDGTTALHWAVRADDVETNGNVDTSRGEGRCR